MVVDKRIKWGIDLVRLRLAKVFTCFSGEHEPFSTNVIFVSESQTTKDYSASGLYSRTTDTEKLWGLFSDLEDNLLQIFLSWEALFGLCW